MAINKEEQEVEESGEFIGVDDAEKLVAHNLLLKSEDGYRIEENILANINGMLELDLGHANLEFDVLIDEELPEDEILCQMIFNAVYKAIYHRFDFRIEIDLHLYLTGILMAFYVDALVDTAKAEVEQEEVAG